MSLKTSIRNAVLKVFESLDDLKDTVTYSSVGSSSYNITTGAVSQTDTDYTGLYFVRDEYKAHELNPAIMKKDFKGYMLYSQLSSITPKNGDYITNGNNVWAVIDWENIYDILWLFQLRPKNNS